MYRSIWYAKHLANSLFFSKNEGSHQGVSRQNSEARTAECRGATCSSSSAGAGDGHCWYGAKTGVRWRWNWFGWSFGKRTKNVCWFWLKGKMIPSKKRKKKVGWWFYWRERHLLKRKICLSSFQISEVFFKFTKAWWWWVGTRSTDWGKKCVRVNHGLFTSSQFGSLCRDFLILGFRGLVKVCVYFNVFYTDRYCGSPKQMVCFPE